MAKQSALHHWAAQAGATFTEHQGWQTPARFTNQEATQVAQSAGLADISWTANPVRSVYAQFLLAGPRSREILSKLTSLNVSGNAFPNGESRQTSLAHVHATLIRRDMHSLPAFHLLITRDYAESVWEAILHAGHEFQIVPFGLDALATLEAQP